MFFIVTLVFFLGLIELLSMYFTGSNLLLHRLLIEKPMDHDLQFISFDSDTNLCPAVYVST